MADTINKDITRKKDDDLVIKFVLGGDNLPAFPWTGATAKISIAEVGGALVRDKVAVTSFDVATGEGEYVGAGLSKSISHEYELLVTFADGKKLRFPNDRNLRLNVIPAIA